MTEQDQELNLRRRLSGLSRLPLLRGARVSGEAERLEKQLERLKADTSDEAIWRSSTTGSSCTATAAGPTTARSSRGSAHSMVARSC